MGMISLSLSLGAIRSASASEPAAPVISSVTILPSPLRVGDTPFASVSRTGYPSPAIAYRWTRNGLLVPGETAQSFGDGISEGDTLIVEAQASNESGVTAWVASATVTVQPALAAPVLTATDSLTGRTLSFSTSATGEPTPEISLVALTLDGSDVLGDVVAGEYDVPSAAIAQTVAWTITATNSEGADSVSGSEIVAADLFAPTAAGGLADLTLAAGVEMTPVDVSADFSGTAPITYALAPSSAALPASLSLSSAGSLSGTPADVTASRSIVIRGANAHGFADTAFTLEVTDQLIAPTIASVSISPSSLQPGDTATAVVSASGVPGPELAYQWLLDGFDEVGATASTFTVTGTDPLSVRVVASNSEGTATVTSATVVPTDIPFPAILDSYVTAVESATEAGKIYNTFPGVPSLDDFTMQLYVGPETPPPTGTTVSTLTASDIASGRTTNSTYPDGATRYSHVRWRRNYDLATGPWNETGKAVTIAGTPAAVWTIEDSADGVLVVTGEPEVTATHIVFEVTSPVEYAATYAAPIADLATGPVNVVAPTVSGDSGEGNVLTSTPGLWIGEGYIDFTREWVRNGVVVGTGATYTQQAGDTTYGVDYVETATDANGARSATVEAVAFGFTPNLLRITDQMSFVTDSTAVTKFAFACRFTLQMFNSFDYIWYHDTSGRLSLTTGNKIQFVLRDSTTTEIGVLGPSAIGYNVGDTVSVMFAVDYSGVDLGGVTAKLVFNGGTAYTTTAAGTGTTGGANNPIFPFHPDLDVHAWVWFARGATLDPETHWSSFFNPDNTVKDLGATGVIGGVTPWTYMKGPAADWNARINYGSGPQPSVNGVITDV